MAHSQTDAQRGNPSVLRVAEPCARMADYPCRVRKTDDCGRVWMLRGLESLGAHDMAAKCEVCKSLSATHVEAVIQQLQQAMRLDRALRFDGDIGSALSHAQEHILCQRLESSG